MRSSTVSLCRAVLVGILAAALVHAQAGPPVAAPLPPPASVPSSYAATGPGSGALCDPRRSTLDPLTHRFRSDCSPREWCSPSPLDPSLLTASPQLPSDGTSSSATPSPSASSTSSTAPAAAMNRHASGTSTLRPSQPPKAQQEASVFKQKAGNDEGSNDGFDSDSGSYDDEDRHDSGSETDDYGDDGEDSLWRRTVWDTLDDWQSFRRTLAQRAVDAYNQSDFVPSSASQPKPPGPVRVSLPPSLHTASTGLPAPTSGVCRPKGCRRDEYPFGYKGVPPEQIPPMCGPGFYCPDEENACEPLIPLGGVCQLNRDDSCSPPASVPLPSQAGPSLGIVSSVNSSPSLSRSSMSTAAAAAPTPTTAQPFDPPLPEGLARRILDALMMRRRDVGVQVAASQSSSTSSSAAAPGPTTPATPRWNASRMLPGAGNVLLTTPGSAVPGAAKPMCLQGVCHLADASQGQACIIDHTQYLGYDSDGKEVVDTVSRDNCRDRLYCDEQTRVCLPEKSQGESCASDRECLEFNCNARGLCDLPPEAPNRLPAWAFVLIGLAILSSLIFTVYGLYRVHLAHRASRAEEIDRYFSEQWTFRQSILSMHAAALAATGGLGLSRSRSNSAVAKASLLVGSPNGSLYMSPIGTRHLRVLSVDRRDSEDSENTLHSGGGGGGGHYPPAGQEANGLGLVHPHNYGYGIPDGAAAAAAAASRATGVQTSVGGGGADPASGSPFLDGRLSKRKPAPAT